MASPTVFLDIVPYESAFTWRNDPKIYRWCRQHTTRSFSQHRDYWERIEQDASCQFYGIFRPSPPGKITAIGVTGLTSINWISRSAEFSLYIAPGYQGKGHAKDALIELFARGFHELNLNRIWGETFDDNHAQNLFRSLGMHEEGRLRETYFKNGSMCDSIMFSLLRREWDAKYSTAYLRHVIHNTSRQSLSYSANT